jgi:hypothetical protein
MSNLFPFIKRHWWPISAVLFCPCHLPLSMGAIAALASGTLFGAVFSAWYSTIETVLAIVFSFYFVIAFLLWLASGPLMLDKSARTCNTARKPAFSTSQTVSWGVGSALLMPTLVLSAFVSRNGLLEEIVRGARGFDWTNSGFIWLLSISAIVMIPVMVVWIAWMWIMWTRHDPDSPPEKWEKEYEHE